MLTVAANQRQQAEELYAEITCRASEKQQNFSSWVYSGVQKAIFRYTNDDRHGTTVKNSNKNIAVKRTINTI